MAPLTQLRADPEELILGHRRLARRLAQRYARGGEPFDDLEQVAYLGLVKAARRFDPDRGVAFSSFAVPTVLGELRRHCRDTRWAVHVPRGVQEDVQRLRRLEDAHQTEHGRAPSAAEAATALGWSEERVLEARLAAGGLSPESLNVPLNADGSAGEAIDAVGGIDDGFERAELRDELARALEQVGDAERRALRLRGEAGCSTPEIALRMGLSRPQAARLIRRALAALRSALDGEPERPPALGGVVRLADVAPSLFAGLDAPARARAGRVTVASKVLEPGPWDGPADGVIVLGGALLRTVALGDQLRGELIGPGDVLLGTPAAPAGASWQVVARAHVALLDRRVLDAVCAWPPVVASMLEQAARRADALALQLAIAQQRRVDDRVLCLFGMIAERWGRPSADGVAISLPLTHDALAMLVGAHRPTVTSALRRLSLAGRLGRDGHGHWRLRGGERAPLQLAA